jgi:hypothetical protein
MAADVGVMTKMICIHTHTHRAETLDERRSKYQKREL